MIRTVLLAVVAATSIGIADPSFGQAYYSHSGLQGIRSTLPERLGYPADAKLLIVHADDLGMAHSIDAATIKAFEWAGHLRQHYGSLSLAARDSGLCTKSS